ncbi:hypothetical protein ANSO36C_51220 [Nostoc cf. commune SO-36]|uniref:DUF202 domain-containing protein n=1 Tax=Nostoc cf. commune SO-36 TaxID=449208 RepID=A0ABM7Z808_NOSCO|nr:hypothetical protein ANSO36C_51220 [Nostoc cf. commune SO-36]
MKIEAEKLEVKNLEKKKYRSDRIRDHLANERTYLAWMRSGIALMGFGVLIVRLRIIRPPLAPQPPGNGWKLGLAFALVGVLTVLLSTQHYSLFVEILTRILINRQTVGYLCESSCGSPRWGCTILCVHSSSRLFE